ncbi:MAG: hypothetical protein RR620_00120 [Clostridium sp.]
MNDREYIIKEAELVLKYILEDNEKFDNKKQARARIFNSIKGVVTCQIGGLNELDIAIEDVKSIINNMVDANIDKLI